MKKIFSPVFDFSAFLFPIVLVFYLILFLLENVFPGFVSNNFDLNYFLIPVIVFGFLAALSSSQKSEVSSREEASPPTQGDFILIAGLTVLSFVILVYKTSDLGLTGFIVSLVGSILILFMSLVLIVFPDMDKAEEEIAKTSEGEFGIRNLNRAKYNYKKFFLSPVGLSLTGLVIFIIAGGLIYSLYFRSPPKQSEVRSQKSEVSIQQPRVEIPDPELLEKTQIIVQNGSGVPGKAASVAAFLRDFSFGAVKTGDANNSNYKNAYLRFNLEDLKVASYMTFLLSDNDKYKIINMLPPINASQSGIILIIGQ